MAYSEFSNSRPPSVSRNAPNSEGTSTPITNNYTDGPPASRTNRNLPPRTLIEPPSQIYSKYQLNADLNDRVNLDMPHNLDVYVERIDKFGTNLGVTFKQYNSSDWDNDNDKALIDFQHGGNYLSGEELLTDWVFTSRDGSPGILYIRADDQKGQFSTWFVKKNEKVIQSVKSPPGFFQRGVGPLGWLLYQTGGWDEIDAFNRWESGFSESARIYMTYSAPLSSDVFRISEAITGHSIEGNEAFSNEERVEKFISGIKGIVGLAGSSEIEFLCGFLDQFVDYLIEKIDNETVRNDVKAVKEFLKDKFDGVEVDDIIERLKKKLNGTKKRNLNLKSGNPFG